MTGSNQTLSMDVLAEGGVPLRLTVHRTRVRIPMKRVVKILEG